MSRLIATTRAPIVEKGVELSVSPYEEQVKRDFRLKWESEVRKLKRLGTVETDADLVHACKRFASRYDKKWRTRFREYVVENYDSTRHVTVFEYTGRVL